MLLRHYLKQGTSKSAMARQLGVSRDTIHRWIRAGDLDRDLDGEPVRYGPRAPAATKLDAYKPIIEARLAMYGAMAEARMAFFFHRIGFHILRWEPEEVANHPGDLDILWNDGEPIFVEVKGPGWEGELTEEERRAGRKERPKYINAEARVIEPVERVEYAVKKALPKFSSERTNLVAVVDDLFFSPTESATEILNGRINRTLADTQCRRVAGVYLMNPVSFSGSAAVEYRTYFVPNQNADRPLPDSVRSGFLADNSNPHGPRRERKQ